MASAQHVKELQWFLGFVSFYCWFIRNYTLIAAPMTSLLKEKTAKLKCKFKDLKARFMTEPILKSPEPFPSLWKRVHQTMGFYELWLWYAMHSGGRTWTRISLTMLKLALFVFTKSKTPHKLPTGLLQPIPISQHSWSSLSTDFITDLANFNSYTTILVIIDCFFQTDTTQGFSYNHGNWSHTNFTCI